jgi:Carboxypeptidase regulatory-like domain
MHRARWMTVLCTAALLAPLASAFGLAQEPATSLPSSAPASPSPAASTSKPGKTKYSHTNDFLIRGTVFNDKALSAPGAQLRIRKAGEKKFRWESYTNSRGEFAVRVPQGSDYVMVVRAKGFVEQTRTIDAKNGGNEESMVFRMQPAAGDKK